MFTKNGGAKNSMKLDGNKKKITIWEKMEYEKVTVLSITSPFQVYISEVRRLDDKIVKSQWYCG